MTAPHSVTSPPDTARTRKNQLSLTQVAAGALSAVTVAVLGSQLGAAGTLIGAAGASVITTVGTAVYQASLERSRERVRLLAQRTRSSPISRDGSWTEQPRPAPLRSEQFDDGAGQGSDHQGPDQRLRPRDRSRKLAALRWGAVVVGALGAFLLAMMVITGFEVATGQTIGGNGHGTTFGQVVDAPAGPRNHRPAIPPASESSVAPTSEPPSETTSAPDTAASATTTPAPDASTSPEPSPSNSYDRPGPSGPTPTPPLLPTGLPGRNMPLP